MRPTASTSTRRCATGEVSRSLRITYGPGPSEIAAQAFYLPWVVKLLKAAGADVAIAIPELPSTRFPIAQDQVPATEHVMGGMPMGTDARTSVTDEQGRHHHLDNLFVADGAVFPTSGGAQPDSHDHGDSAPPGDRRLGLSCRAEPAPAAPRRDGRRRRSGRSCPDSIR